VTQARNLAAVLEDENRSVNFRIRDRDTKFVGPFDEVITTVGARRDQDPGAGTAGERLRRTVRPHRADRVPRLASLSGTSAISSGSLSSS
jgi:hypothetical protein